MITSLYWQCYESERSRKHITSGASMGFFDLHIVFDLQMCLTCNAETWTRKDMDRYSRNGPENDDDAWWLIDDDGDCHKDALHGDDADYDDDDYVDNISSNDNNESLLGQKQISELAFSKNHITVSFSYTKSAFWFTIEMVLFQICPQTRLRSLYLFSNLDIIRTGQ